MQRGELSRTELQKIVDDKLSEKTDEIITQGYKIRFPRAEFSVPKNCLLMISSFRDVREIPEERLRKILSGIEKVPDSDKKIIDEWYGISLYRFGYKEERLRSAIRLAKNAGCKQEARQLAGKLRDLNDKYKWLDMREFRKKQLAYYYNENGERLENLYSIIEGDLERVNLRFGCIDASISANCYNNSMLAKSYEAGRGFFEDLNNAYDFIAELKGPVRFSKSTGIVYSDEQAYCKGKGCVNVASRSIGLEAKIEKDGLKDVFDCQVNSSELKIDRKDAMKKGRLLLPDYGFRIQEPFFFGGKDENFFIFIYYNSKFFFIGNPKEIEAEMPRFLETILK